MACTRVLLPCLYDYLFYARYSIFLHGKLAHLQSKSHYVHATNNRQPKICIFSPETLASKKRVHASTLHSGICTDKICL